MMIPWIALGAAGAYLYAVKPSSRKDWVKEFAHVLYAHRGLYDNRRGIPENSMAAFRLAKEHGYGIELDVQLSRDGIPVIIHDNTLDRVVRNSEGTPVSGKTTDYTLDELKQFHLLDSEERIPAFAEVLELINGEVPLIVEMKTGDGDHQVPVCEKADALLQNYNGPYVVESFNPFAVAWYRRNRPEIIRGQLSEAFTKNPKYRRPSALASEFLLFDGITRPDFIAYNAKHWKNPSRNVTRKLFHCPAVAWTIQSQEELDAMRPHFDLFIFEGFLPENGQKSAPNPAESA